MSQGKSARLMLGLLAIMSLGAAAYALAADDAKKADGGDARPAAASDSADQAKMMEMWMALAKPGEPHARLKEMAGEFDVEVEVVMQPGTPPQKSKGKEKSRMVMGGRYLQGDFTGTMMGSEFHGASMMGYDNAKKKYFSAWVDDMSTGIMLGEGTASADGKVITMSGEYEDPMSQSKRRYRWVTTAQGRDKYVFDWFDADKEGKNEFRMMHNVYTRVR